MDPKKYKIGIIGLGPVGLVLGVHLQEAGCEVLICDVEKKKINLIRSNGVELTGKITKNTFGNETIVSVEKKNSYTVIIS